MYRIRVIFLFALFVFITNQSLSQNSSLRKELRPKLMKIVNSYKATVGIGLIHIETGDSLDVNNHIRFPMLSVYKFPLALAVLDLVDKGDLKLDQIYHVKKSDLIDDTWSPLKKEFPEGEVDLTIAQLLDYSVSQSDNIACDILFSLAKGTQSVNEYIHGIGIQGMDIQATEHEMQADWKILYTNWSKPMQMSHLLEGLYRQKYLSDSSNAFLMKLMIESSNDPARIKALLPEGTIVAHKTGTSDRRGNIYDACNDVGIIFLPDGTHLALSVFVSKSEEDYDTTRKLIAEISKAVYDFYSAN
ncbi:class A beta-lactamase, subclass A2 [Fluviicola sp.]|uniref:class A beta-lactamase, subclass A2 n=1 Tax=Fluviicola sp. TaxID=1917219 RepID=UPI0031DE2041